MLGSHLAILRPPIVVCNVFPVLALCTVRGIGRPVGVPAISVRSKSYINNTVSNLPPRPTSPNLLP